MKTKIISITVVILLVVTGSNSQAQTVKGTVLYHDETMGGMEMPLNFAVVVWMGGTTGITTGDDGSFSLFHPDSLSKQLIISYVGYKSDTVLADFNKQMKIILEKSVTLKGVTVTDDHLSFISTKPMNQLNIGSGELKLAACCNLGESFQTTPQVDVSTKDAVTGARQIQLLGLTGNYTQVLIENTPQLTGLSKTFGLDYIPGPWIEGIQLTQGVGSVTNGYEGLNGTINVELKKPGKNQDLFLNFYANNFGGSESNVDAALKLSNHWSTILLVHSNDNSDKMDKNHDGFLDMPLGNQIHLSNRWLYVQNDTGGIQFRFGFDILTQNKTGGQIGFKTTDNPLTSPYYGISVKTMREGAYIKLGYVSREASYRSSGLILSGFNHTQDSYFGRTQWNGDEQNFTAKYIYQSIINNTNHVVRMGAAYLYDNETNHLSFLNEQAINNPIYQSVPGAFAEYEFTGRKTAIVAGMRSDYHNKYGFIYTPRGFIKYNFTKKTTLKLLAGSAFHQADIISENVSLLASSRQWNVPETLKPERAINTGAAFQHTFKINYQDGDIIVNAYHTWFTDQVIVDLNRNPTAVLFYNLNGTSYADNLLVQMDYSFIKNLNLKLAYRYNNVKQQEESGLREKTFLVQTKLYAGMDYTTENKHWKASANWQYFGPQHLPDYPVSQTNYELPATSPSFQLLNAQLTYLIPKFDFYLGAENLLNQTQHQVIINAQDPFNSLFDASMIWGPVTGRMFYAGIRVTVE